MPFIARMPCMLNYLSIFTHFRCTTVYLQHLTEKLCELLDTKKVRITLKAYEVCLEHHHKLCVADTAFFHNRPLLNVRVIQEMRSWVKLSAPVCRMWIFDAMYKRNAHTDVVRFARVQVQYHDDESNVLERVEDDIIQFSNSENITTALFETP